MAARILSLLVLLAALAIGFWVVFLRDPMPPLRTGDSADGPFRFLDWVRENDFDAAGAGKIVDVDRLVFDREASKTRITRTEDVGSMTIEDAALAVSVDGNRARVYISVDREASEINTIFVRLKGEGTVDIARLGWHARADGRRFSSRGAMPLVRVEHEPDLYMFSLVTNPNWIGRIEEVFVQFGTLAGDEVELSSITLSRVPLSARWLELERRESLTGRVSIDGDTRESVLVAPPARIDGVFTPEPGAVLEFGYAVLPSAWRTPGDAVRFRVLATPLESAEDDAESETELFTADLDPARIIEDRAWHFARVELSDYVGRETNVSLVTERIAPDGGAASGGAARDAADEIPAVFASPTVHVPRHADDPPNILLVSLDTLRADRLGSQGHPVATSPVLDRFARESVQFRAAVSHAASTGPSHMSLFTSLHPTVHGVISQSSRLSSEVITMAEIFHDAGYATEAITNGGYIRGQLGFDQGFDTYLDRKYNVENESGRIDEMVDRAVASLERHQDRPFLLFLHSYEIHAPYCPIEPYAEMFESGYEGPLNDCVDADMIDELNHGCVGCGELTEDNYMSRPPTARDVEHVNRLYDAGIRQTDHAIGRLLATLDRLDLARNTVVVFFSDHGEDLGDHLDIGRHAHSLYEEIVHVPLLLRWPAVARAPRVIEAPTALMDLLPTFVEILDLPTEAEFQGLSIAATLRGGDEDPTYATLPIYSENFRHGSAIRMAMRRGDDKLIHTRTDEVFAGQDVEWDSPRMEGMYPGVELYDLARDAAERDDLAENDAPKRDAMKATLDAHFTEQRARAVTAVKVELSPGMVKRLQKLGYLRDGEVPDESGDDESESGEDER